MSAPLRVVVVDDERPARLFLIGLLRTFDDVVLVGEASSGREAIALIEREKPDLALLDLQMPELDGLAVVKALKKYVPLIAFVTAFDEYAVRAFELNVVDYLLKPVEKARLRETLNRAHERAEHEELASEQLGRINGALRTYASLANAPIDRIPVRKRDEVILVPVQQVASIVADGELLHLTTFKNERHVIAYRLKDLELRLDGARFVRLGRGTLVNLDAIAKVNVMPGGTHVALLSNGQKLPISRIQSRVLRERLFRL
jgi:DNA-binding LytR/AlgR family response regulator